MKNVRALGQKAATALDTGGYAASLVAVAFIAALALEAVKRIDVTFDIERELNGCRPRNALRRKYEIGDCGS